MFIAGSLVVLSFNSQQYQRTIGPISIKTGRSDHEISEQPLVGDKTRGLMTGKGTDKIEVGYTRNQIYKDKFTKRINLEA